MASVVPSAICLLSQLRHTARLSRYEQELLRNNNRVKGTASTKQCTIVGSGKSDSDFIGTDVISLNDAFKNYAYRDSDLKYIIHLDSTRYSLDCSNSVYRLSEICPPDTRFVTTIQNLRLSRFEHNRHFYCHPQQILSEKHIPSVFNNRLRPINYYKSRYNMINLSRVCLHPINVLGFAIAWAIFIGYTTIFIEGCQCNWPEFYNTSDFLENKSTFYGNRNLINTSHAEAMQEHTAVSYPIRGRLGEWSSNYTLIDYSRLLFFTLFLLSEVAKQKEVEIINLTKRSYLSEIF